MRDVAPVGLSPNSAVNQPLGVDLHWLAALPDQRGAEDEPLATRVLQAVGQRVSRVR